VSNLKLARWLLIAVLLAVPFSLGCGAASGTTDLGEIQDEDPNAPSPEEDPTAVIEP